MAYVNLKNVVAKRSFYDGKGLGVVEQFTKRDGTPGESKYTLFFDQPHGIAEGTRLSKVGGVLSTKGRIYDPEDGEARAVVDVILNNPTYEIDGGGSAPAASGDSDLPW